MTETQQHTPGPWVREEEDGTILILSVDEAYPIAVIEITDQEDYANANLIAAAPDLLAALTELTAWVEELVPTNRQPTDTRVSLLNKSKAAIAKAEGKA